MERAEAALRAALGGGAARSSSDDASALLRSLGETPGAPDFDRLAAASGVDVETMRRHAADLWKHMDDLAERSPEEYRAFLAEQAKNAGVTPPPSADAPPAFGSAAPAGGGAGGARSDPPSAQTSPATLDGASRGGQKTLPARDEKRVDAGDDESNRKRRGPFATKKKDRVASRRDPLSFSTPFISNAHTRFHGEISAADKRLFFSEGNKGSEDEDEEGFRDALGSDSDSPRRKPGSRVDDDAPSSRDWIARGLPRPTKKSEASAAEARRRAAETARRRAAARAEKSGASFGGEKTKKGAASLGRNRVPRVEEKDEKEGFARSRDHPIPIRDGTSSGGASEADASSRRGYRYPSRVYPPSYAEARLDAARSLLADLDTGAPLTPEDASLLELERRSSRAIARVRAYRSAVESPPGAVSYTHLTLPTIPLV